MIRAAVGAGSWARKSQVDFLIVLDLCPVADIKKALTGPPFAKLPSLGEEFVDLAH